MQKQEGRSDLLPPCPSSLKLAIKPSYERCPPYTQRKGVSLAPKTKGGQEESEQTGLAKFSPVYYDYIILLNLSRSSRTVHSSANWHKST